MPRNDINPTDIVIIECPDFETMALVLQAIDDNTQDGDLSTFGILFYMDFPMVDGTGAYIQ